MTQGVGEFFKNLLSSTGLAKYERFGKLDEGRMSVIYKARDKKLVRSCLLKIYKEDCIRIRNAIRRKQPDIEELLLSIDHPYVMKIYEFDNTKGHEYSAIEAIDGPALGTLAREGKVTLEDMVNIFAKCAVGLQYLHEEIGILHRDFNPYNIVVTGGNHPKIIDLDFAIREADDTAGMYRRSGTVSYLSPEQVRGKHLDHRVDIYAFGITMYECLTNINPYWERDEENEQLRIDRTAYNHLVMTPPAPSEINKSIPPELDELILSCIEREKDKRPQTAQEVKELLRKIVPEREEEKNQTPDALF